MNSTTEKIQDYATTKFMKLGIRSVSMDDIATDLGVSKKTLYKYYNKKEALVDECMTAVINEEVNIIAQIQQNATDAVDEMAQVSRHAVRVFKQYRPVLIHDLQKYYKTTWTKLQQMQSKFIKTTIAINLKRGIREGVYRSDIDTDIISSLYVAKALAISDESFMNWTKHDPTSIMKQHILYHLHGILSPEGLVKLNKENLFNE